MSIPSGSHIQLGEPLAYRRTAAIYAWCENPCLGTRSDCLTVWSADATAILDYKAHGLYFIWS